MQDGSNFSDTETITSKMREERFLMSPVELMLKTETLLSIRNIMEETKNGASFMLIKLQNQSQLKDSIQPLVSISIDLSILFLNSVNADTLIWSAET